MHIGKGTKFGRANLLISTCSISFLPNYSFSILSASFDCFTTYLLLKQLPPSLMCNCAIRLRNTRGHPFNLTLSCEDTFLFQPNTPSRQFNLQRRRSKLPISVHRFFENLTSLITSRFIDAIFDVLARK